MSYCHRCDRRFENGSSKRQHLENSSSHNQCEICSYDGPEWTSLLEHYDRTGHRVVCWGCDEGHGVSWIPNSKAYRLHLTRCNVCQECHQHFETRNDLNQHKVVHYMPSVGCYGCDEVFNEYRSMILHLESGFCHSGTDVRDLNRWAAQCFQWESYVDPKYRQDMLERVDIRDEYGAVYPFYCPGCEREFSLLSGLFQHVSTDSCDETLGSRTMKKLQRWLQNQF